MFTLPFLKPKDNKFCVLLEGLSQEARACAVHLKTFVESTDPQTRQQAAAAITQARRQSKDLTAQITAALCRTFITPFDREDIQDMADNLYKIPKTIEKIHHRISNHGLSSVQGDFSRQIDVIVQEADAMEEMVKELIKPAHDDKRIFMVARQLQELENKGDAILSELLVELFKGDNDARDLILRKDIYDMLEKVVDRYRDAASVALQIVLKHS